MRSNVSSTTLTLGGIPLTIYGLSELPKEPTAVDLLFFLHGRTSDRKALDLPIREVLPKLARPTLVVAFDHRNHGERMVEYNANRGWNDSGQPKDTFDNEAHAVDMPSIYCASDIILPYRNIDQSMY